MSSPVSRQHAGPHSTAVTWVGTYRIRTPGLLTSDNGTLLLPTGDEVQPAVCLYRPPPLGNVRYVERREGKERVSYLEGAPDLVFEVAASSASYDLHSKKRAYERSGVPEYIVWQLYERRLTWFRLTDGR